MGWDGGVTGSGGVPWDGDGGADGSFGVRASPFQACRQPPSLSRGEAWAWWRCLHSEARERG